MVVEFIIKNFFDDVAIVGYIVVFEKVGKPLRQDGFVCGKEDRQRC